MFKKAEKSGLKIRVAVIGPSGSGKTYSALRLASGIGGKIAMIDTEVGRGKYYADEFNYDYMELTPPYKPERFIEAVTAAVAAGYDTVIIDSASHEWNGKGGILEEHSAMSGNSYTNWSKLTPRHQRFIDCIIQSNCNIITTLRGKDEYVMSDRNGKAVPEKVGMGAVMRDGFEYEMTCSFMLSTSSHAAEVMKDNTHIFNSVEMLTEEHGKLLKKWADGGIPAPKPETITEEQVQEILTLCDSRGLDPADVLLKSKLKNGFAGCPAERFDGLMTFINGLAKDKADETVY